MTNITSRQITPEIFQQIVNDIYSGQGIIATCEKHNIRYRAFREYVASNPEREAVYELAREARTDLHAEEIITISDTEPDPQKARNRIDARKWLASKMNPRRYGDRIDLNVSGNLDLTAALEAGKRRALLPGSDSIEAEFVKYPVFPEISQRTATGSETVEQTEELADPVESLVDPMS